MGERLLAVVERPTGNPVPASQQLPDGRVVVAGWIARTSGRPVRVRAAVGNAAAAETVADDVRPDVAMSHPELAGADRSGFVLLVDPPRGAEKDRLRVEAVLEDGIEILDDRPIELDPTAPRADLDLDEPFFDPGPGGRPPVRRGEPSLLLVGNDFRLGGAPRSLLELGARLGRDGFPLRILGPGDGPLAARFREAGIEVEHVGDPGRIPDLDDYRMRIRRLAARAAGARPDVVVCNTLDAFWGVDLAEELGAPVVWIVRESVDAETYFFGRWPYPIARRAIGALSRADRVVFVARATSALFERYVPPARLRVIHNGLDFSDVPSAVEPRERLAARRRLQLPEHGPIATCVGTVCPRKGQRVLVEAVARLAARGTAPLCLLVGARPGDDLELVRRRVERLDLEADVRLVPELPDPAAYYRAADVAVCPSFEESLPRVVIEAMGFGLPVVASRVNGVPELIEDGKHGWLVPPGRPEPLASAIARVLADPARAAEMGHAARARALSRFEIDRMVAAYAALLREVADRPATEDA